MKKIAGFGINDVGGKIRIIGEDGRERKEPVYAAWAAMIYRVKKDYFPCYEGTEIHPDWVFLSNFKDWYEENYVSGYYLDKDLLCREGKSIYGPQTCLYIPRWLNAAIAIKRKGELTGVRVSPGGKYIASLNINFKCKYVGIYETAEEAHRMWSIHKFWYLYERLILEPNLSPKVIPALRAYLNLED